MIVIASVGSITDREKRKTVTYESEDVCEYGDGTLKDKEVESLRETVKDQLSNPSLTNAVLGIYIKEDKRNLTKIIKSMNDLYEYSVNHKYNPTAITYIQAYKYGESFITWIVENKKEVNVESTKEYMTVINRKNNDYRYFVDVMSLISETCAVNTDGLPLDKPYNITGWYPTYGKNGDGMAHYGIDIGVVVGTPVYAVADGIVLQTHNKCDPLGGFYGNMCGYYGTGNYVYYKYEINNKTYYVWNLHMKQVDVKVGDHLVKGQKIGLSGHSGNSEGPHLHFEIQTVEGALNKHDGVQNPCDVVKALCE